MGTSHRCCIMRKVTCKESTAGGRFESFLNSGLYVPGNPLFILEVFNLTQSSKNASREWHFSMPLLLK